MTLDCGGLEKASEAFTKRFQGWLEVSAWPSTGSLCFPRLSTSQTGDKMVPSKHQLRVWAEQGQELRMDDSIHHILFISHKKSVYVREFLVEKG